MNTIGIVSAAIALVPAPKEQVWREGTCACAAAAGAFYAWKTLKQLKVGGAPLK